jgi:ribosomal 30S subunit maturation factor RimM
MADPTDVLGAPVADLGLSEGVPVYDREGQRIGVVDRVMRDAATEIITNKSIDARGGVHADGP